MKQPFTTDDYLQAIQRELGKRATTYPKIIKKMQKGGAELQEVVDRQREMNKHTSRLNDAKFIVDGVIRYSSDPLGFLTRANFALDELIRELKMRKSYYPRLIWLDRNRKSPRMTQETADYELAVWESLTRWFAKEYLDLDELPTKRKKKQ